MEQATIVTTARVVTARILQRIGLVGLYLRIVTLIIFLYVLNVLDTLSTDKILQYQSIGAREANPLAFLAYSHNILGAIKLVVITLFAVVIVRKRRDVKVDVAIATAFVCGIYAAAVLSNILVLHMIGKLS